MSTGAKVKLSEVEGGDAEVGEVPERAVSSMSRSLVIKTLRVEGL